MRYCPLWKSKDGEYTKYHLFILCKNHAKGAHWKIALDFKHLEKAHLGMCKKIPSLLSNWILLLGKALHTEGIRIKSKSEQEQGTEGPQAILGYSLGRISHYGKWHNYCYSKIKMSSKGFGFDKW